MGRLFKLDRRYRGFGQWTHKYEPGFAGGPERRILNFNQQREFLTGTNGLGCFEFEAYTLQQNGLAVPEWGFNEQGDIFLRGTALVNFQLALGRWQ